MKDSISSSDIFVTGGSGTLGRALAKRRKEEGWTGKMAVYSRDPMKQLKMKATYPDIHYILGDVCDYERLRMAMDGYDILFHLAAQKHIPYGEYDSMDTLNTNLNGTVYACEAAINSGVKQVGFVSTDKAASPLNLYGVSKLAGEKVVQEFARIQDECSFHIVRYGNVLESTGSVIEVWRNMLERGEKIKITDPEMTRFFLSPSQAVDYVLLSITEPSGTITVPKMKSLSLAKLAEYGAGATEWDRMPIRPGEKIHETLVTEGELRATTEHDGYFRIWPSTADGFLDSRVALKLPYASDTAIELTKERLLEMLND